MNDEVKPAGGAVTGNFTLQAQLPNGKNFTVSGYLYDEESVESVNARVDLLADVVDRQRTRAEIPELEAKRDQTIKALQQMRDVLTGLEAKQAGGGKLTSQEKQMVANMGTSIERAREDIEKGAAAIAEAKRKAGVA